MVDNGLTFSVLCLCQGLERNMKNSEFRIFVNRVYQDCILERSRTGLSDIESKEYFNQYKYWLKREFKYQRGKK